MQVTIEKINREVQELSVEDLKKVRQLLDSLIEKKELKPTMTEEEFLKELEAEGFIGKVPPPITDFSHYDNYKPVTVTGEPISEMIIRERR
jgi:adenylosuccinate lyase